MERHPLLTYLGLVIVEVSSGSLTVEMGIRPELTIDGRTVQGAVLGVLADYAGAGACASVHGEGWMPVTLTYSVSVVSPAVGERLQAVGTVVGGGRTVNFSHVEVNALSQGASTRVAVAAVTARLVNTSS
jgi:uncharacterized protein (TIGR00369 family)